MGASPGVPGLRHRFEAAVRNFVLNQRGFDSTKEFIDRQQRLMDSGGDGVR